MAKGFWKVVLAEIGAALAVVLGKEVTRVASEWADKKRKEKQEKSEESEKSKTEPESGTS